MRAMLAPTWTHGYMMAFVGGKHRYIMGHYQIFKMNQRRVGGAINPICHNEKTSACVLHALWRNDSTAENNWKNEICSGYKWICCIINIVYQKIWPQGIFKSSNPRTMSPSSYYHGWRQNKQCWSVCIKIRWSIFWQRFFLLVYCPRSQPWQFSTSKLGNPLWQCSIK